MFQIMSADQAAALIPDGAWLGLNPFLSLSIPHALHNAIAKRFRGTGHPNQLSVYSPCGFGAWDAAQSVDQYAEALRAVVTSHYPSMPAIERLAREGKIEAYCLPLGVMSHCVRAAAAGHKGYLSRVGLNIFVDPRIEGPALNNRSGQKWVDVARVAGEDFLYYKTPEIDVALIKGTSADPVGNISFSDECVVGDALALAQATKARGGTVIVQVDRLSHTFDRPRNVVVPGILVDVVVVDYVSADAGEGIKALSGGIHVPGTQMDYWMAHIRRTGVGKGNAASEAHRLIGRRAARELRARDVVNLGIGIPEMVGQAASESGILRDLVLTVESGGIGGLPAPGALFGATIGADCVVSMAEQFDFYDGGGLSVCFMGALEVNARGDVNVHKLPDRMVGIGGFGNITGAAKAVVFCLTLTARGLEVESGADGTVRILQEGRVPKFKHQIEAISFSAQNARARGQRVLYVTERCVFEPAEGGLRLAEVYPGIVPERDILPYVEFSLAP